MYIPTWLIILIAVGAFLYYLTRKKKIEFSPFWIQIQPNWYQLLKDYRLIDDDSWKRIGEKVEKRYKERPGYNVLEDGITFTVLKSEGNSDLVYNNNHATFHSDVDFRERISDIEMESKRKLLPFSPAFSVKWGIDGYKLSITTPESFEKVFMVGDDNDLIEITTIPYGLFHMSKYRFGVLKQKELDKFIQKYGWTMKEQHSEESLAGWPRELEHKYFRVYYKYI